MPLRTLPITSQIALSKIGDLSFRTAHLKTDVFLIVGDPFLRTQKISALISEIEKKSAGPLARQTFSLDETSLEAILASARTLPFFSTQQMLLNLLRRPQRTHQKIDRSLEEGRVVTFDLVTQKEHRPARNKRN